MIECLYLPRPIGLLPQQRATYESLNGSYRSFQLECYRGLSILTAESQQTELLDVYVAPGVFEDYPSFLLHSPVIPVDPRYYVRRGLSSRRMAAQCGRRFVDNLLGADDGQCLVWAKAQVEFSESAQPCRLTVRFVFPDGGTMPYGIQAEGDSQTEAMIEFHQQCDVMFAELGRQGVTFVLPTQIGAEWR